MNKQIVSNDGGREQHALDPIVIVEDRATWGTKLRQWRQPMTFEDRLSWLHNNHVKEGNSPERFMFFLELADRYGEGELFAHLPDHKECLFANSSSLPIATFKSRIAKKAFSILCNDYFSEETSDCPLHLRYKDPLFSKLLWFFRPYGGYGGWDNLRPKDKDGLGKDGGKHYVQTARDFAKGFVLDAWQMLNHHWYKSWDCDNSNPKVAEAHWRDIVVLMRHLDMLENIESGQYIPIPTVFRKMLQMAIEGASVTFDEEDLEDPNLVGRFLEPLVKKGDRLARSLNIARLNVNDYDHSSYRI